MRVFARCIHVVVALPAILGAVALIVLVGGVLQWHPLWKEPELTLSEAAALKDRGTMLRLLRDGADPNARAQVRGGVVDDDELVLTPLEASVATRTPDAMRLLLAHGARLGERELAVVFCLARQEDAREILDFLSTRPSQRDPDCTHVATPW
ncbi:MAG: hypothetical protein FJW14_09775 [Acidimicrobiia bacterium]|nr:hypothetical protein [Acidimicrobiia bacterium]